jgi:hypothetical protein
MYIKYKILVSIAMFIINTFNFYLLLTREISILKRKIIKLPKILERYFLPKNLGDPNLVDLVSDLLHGG